MSICSAAVELIAKLILNPVDYLSPGCRTRSHRPFTRFRFGDGSQWTDDGQMGRSRYGTWSPAACGQIVRGTRATAVWFVPISNSSNQTIYVPNSSILKMRERHTVCAAQGTGHSAKKVSRSFPRISQAVARAR
jgi:hypothetical protein